MPMPTATPVVEPPGLAEWQGQWRELQVRLFDHQQRTDELADEVFASDVDVSSYLADFRELLRAFLSDEGPYALFTFPRFKEVRELNDEISEWLETEAEQQDLYIRHLETGDAALFDRSDELRIENNRKWRGIVDAVQDFLESYGY